MALGGPSIYPSSGFWMGISREFKSEVSEDAPICCDPLLFADEHDHPPLKWDDEGVPGCRLCERQWECHELGDSQEGSAGEG